MYVEHPVGGMREHLFSKGWLMMKFLRVKLQGQGCENHLDKNCAVVFWFIPENGECIRGNTLCADSANGFPEYEREFIKDILPNLSIFEYSDGAEPKEIFSLREFYKQWKQENWPDDI